MRIYINHIIRFKKYIFLNISFESIWCTHFVFKPYFLNQNFSFKINKLYFHVYFLQNNKMRRIDLQGVSSGFLMLLLIFPNISSSYQENKHCNLANSFNLGKLKGDFFFFCLWVARREFRYRRKKLVFDITWFIFYLSHLFVLMHLHIDPFLFSRFLFWWTYGFNICPQYSIDPWQDICFALSLLCMSICKAFYISRHAFKKFSETLLNCPWVPLRKCHFRVPISLQTCKRVNDRVWA